MDLAAHDEKDEVALEEAVIRFIAQVSRLQTLADGGIRLILDLPEDAIPQMAMLAETKRQGIVLQFEAREES